MREKVSELIFRFIEALASINKFIIAWLVGRGEIQVLRLEHVNKPTDEQTDMRGLSEVSLPTI